MRALLSFFTVLPLRAGTLEDVARGVHLLPLVGMVTGLPGALILASGLLPPGVAASLAFGTALLMAGLHHADGLLDVGDALMAHGNRVRRREVLKDARIGIGGLGALFLVYAPTLAALAALAGSSPLRAALAFLAGEVVARSAMLLLLVLGLPAEPRSSAAPLVRSLKSGPRRYAALLLAAALPMLVALPLGWMFFAAFLAAPVVVVLALWLSNRAFGGIGGDVTGATGELSRMALLVVLAGLV